MSEAAARQIALIARTPRPPYTAVIFTSVRTPHDSGYDTMAAAMDDLAARQPGYLSVENARDQVGITVSYWVDEGAARLWKEVAEHVCAQRLGWSVWYRDYRVRIATVHREYGPAGGTR